MLRMYVRIPALHTHHSSYRHGRLAINGGPRLAGRYPTPLPKKNFSFRNHVSHLLPNLSCFRANLEMWGFFFGGEEVLRGVFHPPCVGADTKRMSVLPGHAASFDLSIPFYTASPTGIPLSWGFRFVLMGRVIGIRMGGTGTGALGDKTYILWAPRE